MPTPKISSIINLIYFGQLFSYKKFLRNFVNFCLGHEVFSQAYLIKKYPVSGELQLDLLQGKKQECLLITSHYSQI